MMPLVQFLTPTLGRRSLSSRSNGYRSDVSGSNYSHYYGPVYSYSENRRPRRRNVSHRDHSHYGLNLSPDRRPRLSDASPRNHSYYRPDPSPDRRFRLSYMSDSYHDYYGPDASHNRHRPHQDDDDDTFESDYSHSGSASRKRFNNWH
eukprot:scaffold6634_cov158-Amphora_coffeaeformis.AAC.21